MERLIRFDAVGDLVRRRAGARNATRTTYHWQQRHPDGTVRHPRVRGAPLPRRGCTSACMICGSTIWPMMHGERLRSLACRAALFGAKGRSTLKSMRRPGNRHLENKMVCAKPGLLGVSGIGVLVLDRVGRGVRGRDAIARIRCRLCRRPAQADAVALPERAGVDQRAGHPWLVGAQRSSASISRTTRGPSRNARRWMPRTASRSPARSSRISIRRVYLMGGLPPMRTSVPTLASTPTKSP